MGISSFLSQGIGVDEMTGQAVDNTDVYERILQGMGVIPKPPSISRSVGASASGVPRSAASVGGSRAAYGSKLSQKALPPASPIAGNMATWTNIR